MVEYSTLGGLVKFNFADWNTREWSWQPTNAVDFKFSVHYPGCIFGPLLYLGIGTSLYFCGRAVYRFASRVSTYFKSTRNAGKYLNSHVEGRSERYTAVIYGAGIKNYFRMQEAMLYLFFLFAILGFI